MMPSTIGPPKNTKPFELCKSGPLRSAECGDGRTAAATLSPFKAQRMAVLPKHAGEERPLSQSLLSSPPLRRETTVELQADRAFESAARPYALSRRALSRAARAATAMGSGISPPRTTRANGAHVPRGVDSNSRRRSSMKYLVASSSKRYTA
eukprot:6202494-Pleurochrysis_carterae.AAC.1